MTLLHYLTFDVSDNDEGVVTIEALASTAAAQHAAVLAEAQQVLDWAWRAFPHTHGPADEGGEWDHDLQVGVEGGRLACRDADAHRHAGVRARIRRRVRRRSRRLAGRVATVEQRVARMGGIDGGVCAAGAKARFPSRHCLATKCDFGCTSCSDTPSRKT